jgi:hypothetical protein
MLPTCERLLAMQYLFLWRESSSVVYTEHFSRTGGEMASAFRGR